MKILAVANQKGGVGKSTLTVHLAYAALDAGLRVLLVDMDKQGSLSLSFTAPDGAAAGLAASRLFLQEPNGDSPQVITDKLAIIRADNALLSIDKAENEVISRPGPALRPFAEDFDLCLLDPPPRLGLRLKTSPAAPRFVVTTC